MEKDIIYSKSFKSWFGDWENDPEHSSKVVDKNGKPLIMYHGTFQHFDTFDPSMGREATDIQGIYLTPDMEEASFYGNNVRAFYVNMRNPADSDEAFNIWFTDCGGYPHRILSGACGRFIDGRYNGICHINNGAIVPRI